MVIKTTRIKKRALFKFATFSKKQRMILNWWTSESPVKKKNGIIADGSIRSGKTIAMSLSFVLWGMTCFSGQNFGMAGKTIGSFRRNVLFWLKLMLFGRGYLVKDHRSDGYVEVTDRRNGRVNFFYIFGGKDESSQDLIQGITLAGMLFDEVALMPESFVNQATGRCSVEGSKYWFNCNPDNPHHYFKKEWIDRRKEKDLIYLHFTMDDNLSLSEAIKKRYKAMYTGVFYKRFILGLWVAAEGLLFPQLANDSEHWEYRSDEGKRLPAFKLINVGLDIGGTRSHSTLVATGITSGFQKLISFQEKKIIHQKGSIDTDRICEETYTFIRTLELNGYIVTTLCVDNAEQVILNTIAGYLSKRGCQTKVTDCKKIKGSSRVLVYNLLLNTDRMLFYRVPMVIESLTTAMYDPNKKEDTILDDFTTDIDTFDAHFYSFSLFLDYLGIMS